MSNWRPQAQIRAVAIGWCWRRNDVLLVETTEADGTILGYRPPGGGIDFGERADQAVIREFQEELDADITVEGPPLIIEHHYHMNGAQGHEVIFTFPVKILSDHVFEADDFEILEPDGNRDIARWIDIDTILKRDLKLLPDELINRLDQLVD